MFNFIIQNFINLFLKIVKNLSFYDDRVGPTLYALSRMHSSANDESESKAKVKTNFQG
jgi:hypothetical protein